MSKISDLPDIIEQMRRIPLLESGGVVPAEATMSLLLDTRLNSGSVTPARIPEDVVEDLKRIAPQLDFSGYQALMRAYIGQGLRQDLARLEDSPLEKFVESLQRHGVERTIIIEAMAEVG